MQITDLTIKPRGTQIERIVAVCSEIPDSHVIGKQELIEACRLSPHCYLQICNDQRLSPYKFTQRGNVGNLWGNPRTIAKLRKMQAKI